jgi:hypothetical protein
MTEKLIKICEQIKNNKIGKELYLGGLIYFYF